MRLLCLTSRLPYPPNRGDRLRAFHFIEHLSRHHELTLVSFIADDEERDHIRPLQHYCQDVHVLKRSVVRSAVTTGLNLWRNEPLQSLYYRDRAMQRLVDQLVSESSFDAAYIHLFRMAPYLANHTSLYRIVDLTDVISQEVIKSLPYRPWFWRLVYGVERPRIAAFERYVAQHFEETWLIAESDRRALQEAVPKSNIQVVPNGVDVEFFRPLEEPPVANSLIFVGHMGVFHNVDAALFLAQEILPRLQRTFPDCRLTIVGAEPARQIQQLAQNPAVTVTGFVPDLNAYLNKAAVFVAPLRFAAGVQNKVLEAMAAALPVVTTSLVNAGIGAEAGRDLFIADDPETAAAQITILFQQEQVRQQMGAAARAFVRQNFSWRFAVRRMAEIEAILKHFREEPPGGSANR
jgi:sugar transferase (PEP-CTERM/EpsH1 system associated)